MPSGDPMLILLICVIFVAILVGIALMFSGIDLENIFSLGQEAGENVATTWNSAQPTNSKIQYSDSIFF
jgi:uncharacterized protein YpmB